MGKLFIVIILMAAIAWFYTKLVKTIINLVYYYRHKDDPLAPRKSGGMLYDKETGELEYAEDELILPF